MHTRSHASQLICSALVVILAVTALGGALFQSPAPVRAAPPGFAYRCGIHFCLDGNFFYFAGTNTYDVMEYGTHAQIDAHFANLQADKVTVLRLWMFNTSGDAHSFEPSKGVYNETEFAQFDYIIQSAKAHNLKLLPSFENYWSAYGGVPKRLSWEGLGGQNSGIFFDKTRCPGCFTQYKNYVNHILTRVNTISGIAYKDEPAIFSWELMNEPRYQGLGEDSTGLTLRAWIDEMGAYIKNLDPNHMLGSGIEGHGTGYFVGDEGNPFIYEHQSPYLDYTSAHPYPDETWANLSIAQTQTLIQKWVNDSHNIVGKPFCACEFNVQASDYAGTRSDWWTAVYGTMESSGGDGDAFWWYTDHSTGERFDVLKGAPELAIFRQHSTNMTAKNGGPTLTPPPPTATPTKTNTPVPPTATPTGTVTVDDSMQGTGQNQFNYVGTGWSHCTNCNEGGAAIFYNSSQSWNTTTNSYVTIAFTGTQIKYYAVKAPDVGIAAVSIDGGAETNVDLYMTPKTGNVLVWTSAALSAGSHTFKMRTTGTKNASSSGTTTTIDRVDILSGPTPTPAPPTATWTNTPVPPTSTPTRTNTPVSATNTPTRTNTPTNTVPPTATPTRTNTPAGTTTVDDSVQGSGQNQWNYSGAGWTHCTNCNETNPPVTFYNASQSYDVTTGDSVTVAFTGTQIKLYAVLGDHHGKAGVSIDGGTETSVDLYAVTKQGNVLVYTSPVLAAGSHTFKVRVTGTKNASSTDFYIPVDRVDIVS